MPRRGLLLPLAAVEYLCCAGSPDTLWLVWQSSKAWRVEFLEPPADWLLTYVCGGNGYALAGTCAGG